VTERHPAPACAFGPPLSEHRVRAQNRTRPHVCALNREPNPRSATSRIAIVAYALEKKLGSKGFVDRAPKEVVEEAEAQRRTMQDALLRLATSQKFAEELEEGEPAIDKT